jgi:hypothetical protein
MALLKHALGVHAAPGVVAAGMLAASCGREPGWGPCSAPEGEEASEEASAASAAWEGMLSSMRMAAAGAGAIARPRMALLTDSARVAVKMSASTVAWPIAKSAVRYNPHSSAMLTEGGVWRRCSVGNQEGSLFRAAPVQA